MLKELKELKYKERKLHYKERITIQRKKDYTTTKKERTRKNKNINNTSLYKCCNQNLQRSQILTKEDGFSARNKYSRKILAKEK